MTTEPSPTEPTVEPDPTPPPATAAAENKDDALAEAWRSFRNMGFAGWLGLATMIIPPIGIGLLIRYTERVQPWIEGLGATGPVVVALLMMLIAGFALAPTQVSSVVVGVLFGASFGLVVASAVAIAGSVGAALVAYGWTWLLAEKKVMNEVEAHPKARIIHRALVGQSFGKQFGLITLLRIPPNLPFATSSFVMASLRVNVIAYALGTLIGMTPRLIVSVWIGSTLGSIGEAKSNPLKFWFLAVSLVFAIVIVLILGRWAKSALAKYDDAAVQPPPASG
jgi:uncharacterized membrane protein YdjX (TVP38/TMEM64 family)